jgi:cyclase
MSIRVIPRLDIKGPNLVKGIHLEGLRVLGKPEDFARHYYEAGADEMIYQDVVASLYGRNSLHQIVARAAESTFIPLTVGGGLRSVDDIRNVLRAGADKVSLNTAAVNDPDLISRAARTFGSSTIVISIEAIRQTDGRYLTFTDNGREHTGAEVISWAKRVEELGAGEICLTSVDREGTGRGYDTDLIAQVAHAVSIPVIAHGGAGSVEHVAEAVLAGASAVAFASIVHYEFVRGYHHSEGHEEEGNTTFLRGDRQFSRVTPVSLQQIKDHLASRGIECRPASAA